jgi:Carboxypeptidase regulatory-like domain
VRRLVAFVGSALALIVVLAIWITSAEQRRGSSPRPPKTPVDLPRGQSIQSPTLSAVDGAQAAPGRSSASAPISDGSVSAGSPARAMCLIRARVVDEAGRGLAGVRVTLSADPTWCAGETGTVLVGEMMLPGYELRTAGNGVFSARLPVPEPDSVFVTLTPDDYHEVFAGRLGGGEERDRPPLHAGENDLGTFTLATGGSMIGSVRDQDGRPVANAEVHIGSSLAYIEDAEARTDDTGRYVLGHIREGTHGVIASAKGYLDAFRTPFEVNRNQTAIGPDFEMMAAPTLRGHVLDEHGVPLANADISGIPSVPESGSMVSAVSEADGSFVLPLTANSPYALEVLLDGYEPYHHNDLKNIYSPGTEDIVCVLKRDVTTTFQVVDADNDRPIQQFALEVLRNKGHSARPYDTTSTDWTLSYASHPDGRLTLGARPGIDRYRVAAPEYARQEGEIVHEPQLSGQQVLRLVRGAALTGVVTLGRGPVADAQLRVERGTMQGAWDGRGYGDPLHFQPQTGYVYFTASDGHGRFHVGGLDPGEYRVKAQMKERSALANVTIGNEHEHDIGTLELLASCAIRGRVVVDRGIAPGALHVLLDAEAGHVTAVTDVLGAFEFRGVAPGKHEVSVMAQPGVLASGPATVIELAPGETKDIVLDVAMRAMCSLEIQVQIDDSAAAHVQVFCQGLHANDWGERLGITGEDGWIRGSVGAVGPVRLLTIAADGAPLGKSSETIMLIGRGSINKTINIVTQSLEIAWAGAPSPQSTQHAELWIAPVFDDGVHEEYPPYVVREGVTADPSLTTANRCVIPAIAPGRYKVSLDSATGYWSGEVQVMSGVGAQMVLQYTKRK